MFCLTHSNLQLSDRVTGKDQILMWVNFAEKYLTIKLIELDAIQSESSHTVHGFVMFLFYAGLPNFRKRNGAPQTYKSKLYTIQMILATGAHNSLAAKQQSNSG